ncbi:MAG: 50S ribosomal protein L31 [Mycoplasmataceae bacterium]|jgi:large subunit ribosomal protein L31|nr:50S ribosomal protein L31 [Mycoplasmataceae bacterium]
MRKEIHPKTQLVKFTCSTCGASFEIESTNKNAQVFLDVCSHCHPVYIGGNVEQKVKGKAERFAGKFKK